MIHIHKWKSIYKIEQDTFLGKKVERRWSPFRRCDRCGKFQEFNDDSQGGSWSTLNNEKSHILARSMKSVKGEWILHETTKGGI